MKAWELAVPPQCGLCRVEGWLGGWADALAGVEGGGLAVYVTQAGVGQGSAGEKELWVGVSWGGGVQALALWTRGGTSGCRRPRTECSVTLPWGLGVADGGSRGVGGAGLGAR